MLSLLFKWSIEDLKTIFNTEGIEADRVIGVTPDIRKLGVTRGSEMMTIQTSMNI